MSTNQYNESQQFIWNSKYHVLPIILLMLMFCVYFFEIFWSKNYNHFGIIPNSLIGLRGVVFTPFLHSSFKHFISNAIPLYLFLIALQFFYASVSKAVLLSIWIFGGFLTWLIADHGTHIGASGLVYGLFGFLIFSGLFRSYKRLVALSFAIIFFYGSMVWYILPIKPGISWEGHLSSFVVGIICALVWRNKGPSKPTYVFAESEFDNFFDENGNLRSSLSEGLVEEDSTSNGDIE